MDKCMIQDCPKEAHTHLNGLNFCTDHYLEVMHAIHENMIRGVIL